MRELGGRLPIIIAAAVLAALLACPAMARVSGPCSNCHTMHNSQNGEVAATDHQGDPDARANPQLLSTSCVGCHSANDGSTWKDPVTGAPIVYNLAEPTYGADAGDGKHQGLAGGNFYWVDQDDSYGHNILTTDGALSTAPGLNPGAACGGSCHTTLNIFPNKEGVPLLPCA